MHSVKFFKFSTTTLFATFLLFYPSYSKSTNLQSQKLEYGKYLKKKIYEVVDKKNVKEDQRIEVILDFLMKEIDIEFFAKHALGRNFKLLSQDQKTRYMNQYKLFLRESLLLNAKEAFLIPGKNVTLLNEIEPVGNDSNIFFNIDPITDKPYKLVIRIGKQEGNGLKVRDVAVENISIINSQQILFTSEIESKGLQSIFGMMESFYTKESKN